MAEEQPYSPGREIFDNPQYKQMEKTAIDHLQSIIYKNKEEILHDLHGKFTERMRKYSEMGKSTETFDRDKYLKYAEFIVNSPSYIQRISNELNEYLIEMYGKNSKTEQLFRSVMDEHQAIKIRQKLWKSYITEPIDALSEMIKDSKQYFEDVRLGRLTTRQTAKKLTKSEDKYNKTLLEVNELKDNLQLHHQALEDIAIFEKLTDALNQQGEIDISISGHMLPIKDEIRDAHGDLSLLRSIRDKYLIEIITTRKLALETGIEPGEFDLRFNVKAIDIDEFKELGSPLKNQMLNALESTSMESILYAIDQSKQRLINIRDDSMTTIGENINVQRIIQKTKKRNDEFMNRRVRMRNVLNPTPGVDVRDSGGPVLGRSHTPRGYGFYGPQGSEGPGGASSSSRATSRATSRDSGFHAPQGSEGPGGASSSSSGFYGRFFPSADAALTPRTSTLLQLGDSLAPSSGETAIIRRGSTIEHGHLTSPRSAGGYTKKRKHKKSNKKRKTHKRKSNKKRKTKRRR